MIGHRHLNPPLELESSPLPQVLPVVNLENLSVPGSRLSYPVPLHFRFHSHFPTVIFGSTPQPTDIFLTVLPVFFDAP